ncbi:MAG: TIGR01212 family radical SAM protein [Bacilli bacterium]|nr:TIGR01212 family radical SAM protein [Bacilli bacterium]
MFKYTLDNKRYHTLNYYYKNKYNDKVFKVYLNAGFSCPNKKNGTGCIYCYNGSGENNGMDLITQFNKVKDIMSKKWNTTKYIGYLQANTNTYAPVNVLKEKYETILNLPNVIGLNIATRCDALPDDVIDYLSELNKRTDLTIELGLQTIHESTSKLINRGHTLECFEEAVKKLRNKNIDVVVHIINGLPFETKEQMIETVKYFSKLDIQGIKIHMLFIEKGTKLEELYNKTHFHVLTKEEYIDIVCDQLELLNEKVVIHRITGDPIKKLLIEPKWLLKKVSVLNDIDKEMSKRNTYQGIKYNK